ncbi:MAG TPA: polysaccharide deacetylase family protein, partial [Bacillota bacterium]|nr:polysaccharide deacetylase family protein [Bacillota bacterium]
LWVKDNPDLAREIVKRGHTIGNHSLTHPHMKEMSAQQMRHEMQESTRIIQEITGVRPFLFRPPYGEYNQLLLEILAETGYPYSIMWTVDTLDWAAGTTMNIGGNQTYIDVDFIVNRALNNASDRGIILMHIGGAETVQALPRIIEGLRSKGYRLATVDEMLPPPGTGPLTHTVKSGETLFSIARRYGVSVQQIIEINNL